MTAQDLRTGSDGIRRRRFLRDALLGCACVLGVRAWSVTAPTGASAPTARLAWRIVALLGTAPSSTAVAESLSLQQLFGELFGSPAATPVALLALSDSELKQHIGARIQQDYQDGELVLHQGWWLARSEAAVLQLRALLPQGRVRA